MRYGILEHWGKLTSIDLIKCDYQLITNANHIKETTKSLCDFIGMKAYGDCIVVDFGEEERVAGFSMLQLIETSNLAAHFVNQTRAVYFDIFSCKDYDEGKVALFLKEAFKSEQAIICQILYRRNH